MRMLSSELQDHSLVMSFWGSQEQIIYFIARDMNEVKNCLNQAYKKIYEDPPTIVGFEYFEQTNAQILLIEVFTKKGKKKIKQYEEKSIGINTFKEEVLLEIVLRSGSMTYRGNYMLAETLIKFCKTSIRK